MKLLDTSIETNADCMGTMRFVQIEKVETPSLNCYIYRREQLDGTFFSYETFIAKRRHKGDKLPGGLVELEDRERFATKNDFGFTAKEAKSLGVAKDFLVEFVAKLKDKEDKKNGVGVVEEDKFSALVATALDLTPKTRGRKRKERPPLVYPTVNQWLMKDLLKANVAEWTQPLVYIQLQKDIADGIVVEIARVKNDSGRGRAMVVYKTVKA